MGQDTKRKFDPPCERCGEESSEMCHRCGRTLCVDCLSCHLAIVAFGPCYEMSGVPCGG